VKKGAIMDIDFLLTRDFTEITDNEETTFLFTNADHTLHGLSRFAMEVLFEIAAARNVKLNVR